MPDAASLATAAAPDTAAMFDQSIVMAGAAQEGSRPEIRPDPDAQPQDTVTQEERVDMPGVTEGEPESTPVEGEVEPVGLPADQLAQEAAAEDTIFPGQEDIDMPGEDQVETEPVPVDGPVEPIILPDPDAQPPDPSQAEDDLSQYRYQYVEESTEVDVPEEQIDMPGVEEDPMITKDPDVQEPEPMP